ncbi:ATP-binding protein [Streptomyces capparidis]
MPATASDAPSAPRARRRRRLRWTARLRLTLLYGALFLLSGAVLLTLTYLLVASRGHMKVLIANGGGQVPLDPDLMREAANAQAARQRRATLRELLTQSAVALASMSAVSVALGWLMAGRVLRPVRTMAERARRISERNLHERLALTGPDDELKDLADTFDDLLGRLHTAFDAQRRFVANASHELRTPLTLQRATIEVALSNPAADAAALRAVCERVLAAGEHQERLIDALLTLARGRRGLQRRDPVDLAAAVGEALRTVPGDGPRLDASLRPARALGDRRLVERLVTNLVDNAVRHNVPGGWLRVATGEEDGAPFLRVANSGPVIPADRVPALLEPFQRLTARTGAPEGHGLGLSIVAAVAEAHDAELTLVPVPEGGLSATVRFRATA